MWKASDPGLPGSLTFSPGANCLSGCSASFTEWLAPSRWVRTQGVCGGPTSGFFSNKAVENLLLLPSGSAPWNNFPKNSPQHFSLHLLGQMLMSWPFLPAWGHCLFRRWVTEKGPPSIAPGVWWKCVFWREWAWEARRLSPGVAWTKIEDEQWYLMSRSTQDSWTYPVINSEISSFA